MIARIMQLISKLSSFPKLTVEVGIRSTPTAAKVEFQWRDQTRSAHMTTMKYPIYRGNYSVSVKKEGYREFRFPLSLIEERDATLVFECRLSPSNDTLESQCARFDEKSKGETQ